MCKIMEELQAEAKAEGRQEGEIIGIVKTLKNMNFSKTEITQRVKKQYNLTEEQVKKYLEELQNSPSLI